jgi:hypothetical protein
MGLPLQVPATRRCYSAVAFATRPSIFPSSCPPARHPDDTLQCGNGCINPDTYYCMDGGAVKWTRGGRHPFNNDDLCFRHWFRVAPGTSTTPPQYEWHEFCAHGTDP